MRHHLQVGSDHSATCSCGKWEKQDPDWEFEDGYFIRDQVWPEFEAHVKADDPTAVKCLWLHGWASTIPAMERRESNCSSGAIFSSQQNVNEYIYKTKMRECSTTFIMMPADDPQIDFNILSSEEQNKRLWIGVKK
jgi:hypothetical protein